MSNAAEIKERSALLSSDFGYQYAVRLFGQEAIDALPTYEKGKNAGKPKGELHWWKCEKGGWDYDYKNGVIRPGFMGALLCSGLGRDSKVERHIVKQSFMYNFYTYDVSIYGEKAAAH